MPSGARKAFPALPFASPGTSPRGPLHTPTMKAPHALAALLLLGTAGRTRAGEACVAFETLGRSLGMPRWSTLSHSSLGADSAEAGAGRPGPTLSLGSSRVTLFHHPPLEHTLPFKSRAVLTDPP